MDTYSIASLWTSLLTTPQRSICHKLKILPNMKLDVESGMHLNGERDLLNRKDVKIWGRVLWRGRYEEGKRDMEREREIWEGEGRYGEGKGDMERVRKIWSREERYGWREIWRVQLIVFNNVLKTWTKFYIYINLHILTHIILYLPIFCEGIILPYTSE